jgi:alcohol dehydrogenase (cytochrome c)
MTFKKHRDLRFRGYPQSSAVFTFRQPFTGLALGLGLSLTALMPQSVHGADAPMGVSAALGNWTVDGGTPQGTRYSELDLINSSNVASLKEEFTVSTGVKGSHMGAPLVVHNVKTAKGTTSVLYVVTPYPNKLIAYDLNNKGAIIWQFTPSVSETAKGRNCCDSTNRGLVHDSTNNQIVYNLLDGYTVAVNAATGLQNWKTRIADPNVGVTTTGAPILGNGVVISGTSSGEMGTRGYVVGLSLVTGKELWRGYNTGPDADVKITSNTHNPYAKDQGTDLGSATWEDANGKPSSKYLQGGSSTWGYLSYNPETDTVFYGTSQPGVWNPDLRPGANKWGAAVFARNASTGEVKWIYQTIEHDNWDYDSAAEITPITLDTPINGVNKVVVQFHKNGFAYVFEETTGKLLQANVFKDQDWAKGGIDLASGIPLLADGKTPATDPHNANKGSPSDTTALAGKQYKYASTDTWQESFCPSPLGGHGWEPSSYSPKHKLFFVPTFNLCASIGAMNAEFISGAPYMGMSMTLLPEDTSHAAYSTLGHIGDLIAWDPSVTTTRDKGAVSNSNIAWSHKEAAPIYGGVLSTAGDLAFYTTLDPNNTFHALDVGNPVKGDVKEVWSAKLECPSTGNPITWKGSDGKQRIAIYSGVGAMVGGMGLFGGNTGKPCTSSNGGVVHVYSLP